VVKSGETVASIASRHKRTPEEVAAANCVGVADKLRVGTKMVVLTAF
jgi:LysM repeat protein